MNVKWSKWAGIRNGAGAMLLSLLAACNNDRQVLIYTNADDEAVQAMETALDGNGYSGRYRICPYSTSELGGKMLAEGSNIEADIITASSYYIDSAQQARNMFRELPFDREALVEAPAYSAPVTGQEGAIFYNTIALQEAGLPVPSSLKGLADPVYKGRISLPSLKSSSTAWLMVLSLIGTYGEEEARSTMKGIIANAGPHLESSGTAPIKKVRAGEVAIGYGLKQQAVIDKRNGLPVEFVIPDERNYLLKESVAVPEHGEGTHPDAMDMARIIAIQSRPTIMKHYPVPLYKGEEYEGEAPRMVPGEFPRPLTVELLKEHQKLLD